MSQVIQTVCDVVAPKQLDESLPSVSTQARLASEMKALSQQQIREAVSDRSHLTLKYDGTTKVGTHLTEVEISTGDQTLLLGKNN